MQELKTCTGPPVFSSVNPNSSISMLSSNASKAEGVQVSSGLHPRLKTQGVMVEYIEDWS